MFPVKTSPHRIYVCPVVTGETLNSNPTVLKLSALKGQGCFIVDEDHILFNSHLTFQMSDVLR